MTRWAMGITASKPATQAPPAWEHTVHSFDVPVIMRSLSSEHERSESDALTHTECETFKIRLANREERWQSANLLVEKLYGARGYDISNVAHHTAAPPGRITFLVQDTQQRPVGTLTIAPDSARGLMADTLYSQELNALRQGPDVHLMEWTQFAMDRHRGNSKDVIAALTNIAYIYTRWLGCTWLIIEVNPRHVGFYESHLGLQVLGPQRVCPRVNAPAVLMGRDVAYATEQVRRLAGRRLGDTSGKSLYRYFLTEQQERELLCRLDSGEASTPPITFY